MDMDESAGNYDIQFIDWTKEAQAVIEDIKPHLIDAHISRKLPCSESNIFINITTLEAKEQCIRISQTGYQIVGNQHDCNNDYDDSFAYETIYSLLSDISKNYVESFGNKLVSALSTLNK